MTTIAVTGATGQLGRLVIAQLKQQSPAVNIIALARNPAKAQDLAVEVQAFDYADTQTMPTALAGVDKLLLISSNEMEQRATHHKNVIAAAKKVGVKQLVYVSLMNVELQLLDLAPQYLESEAALKASGLNYTILRNAWYSENYTASIPAALANGAFYGAAGDGKISSATRADLAEAAAVVLSGTGHEGKIYELAGDTAYTLTELAAEISKQSGKTIPYIDIPEADYAAALKQAGLPAELADGLASWDVGASKGALFSQDRTLSTLLGHPTTSLAAAVKQVLDTL